MTDAGPRPAGQAPPRPVSAWHFARLKLRLVGNGLRGQTWRVVMFVVGVLFALYLAAVSFLLTGALGIAEARTALMVASFGGAGLLVGWTLLPLMWFGMDDTLDPARFALLPLSRQRLVTGLLTAALLGVPAVATLIGTAGLIVSSLARGGVPAAGAQAVGVVVGLLLCVAASRAVVSAFASMLRSRRARDLAGILLAGVVALVAPLPLAAVSAAQRADWAQLASVAQAIGWTPGGAPYTVGIDVAEGRWWAVPPKLAITVAAIAALLWWWSRTLESAMVGTANAGHRGKQTGTARGGPVGQLVPAGARARLLRRMLPWGRPTAFGALVARETRYWWRDAKRRANLISAAVVGIVVPVFITAGLRGFQLSDEGGGAEFAFTASPVMSPAMLNLTLLFIGAFIPVVLANQFGFDGTSYAAHVVIGVPGRRELAARATAFSRYLVPFLVLIGGLIAFIGRDLAVGLAAWGALFAGYGAGLAVNSFLSILGPYALPETANPFAVNTGAGVAKSMLSVLAIVAAGAVAAPVLIAATLLGGAWPWAALPFGLGYGVAATALGCYLAGDVLDRRRPELLSAITPRR